MSSGATRVLPGFPVVSGEYISHLSWNAAKQVRSVFSRQLAALTLGDAGAAVIVERAPHGAPGLDVIGFTTLAGHSRLCLAFPSTVGPGGQMYTKSRTLQKVARRPLRQTAAS